MYIVVFITCQNINEAKRIAETLLSKRLAACVNISSQIESLYWWKDKIEESKECLLIVKSKTTLLNKLINEVKSIHSYELPEIIALPIIGGNTDYIKWLNQETL
ncbi:MAG: divalent-cation tolerance protein CutA [Candidatus Bathyarchaeia archaeon]|nr:divalent-cation tolerance protein CutA [Candidatus Bathyarchaeota archaeon]